jgi:hypothetical protein
MASLSATPSTSTPRPIQIGVLAQQVVGVLGDRDVADHGAEHALRAGVGLARGETRESLLDVRRQLLQRPDVELLCRLLDLF